MGQELQTLGRKTVAVGVLVIAAYVVFKLVIGAVFAVAGFAAVVVAIVAIIWAVNRL